MKRKLQVETAQRMPQSRLILMHNESYKQLQWLLINNSPCMELTNTSLRSIHTTGLQTKAGRIQLITVSLWVVISSKHHIPRKNLAKAHSGGDTLPLKANEQSRLLGEQRSSDSFLCTCWEHMHKHWPPCPQNATMATSQSSQSWNRSRLKRARASSLLWAWTHSRGGEGGVWTELVARAFLLYCQLCGAKRRPCLSGRLRVCSLGRQRGLWLEFTSALKAQNAVGLKLLRDKSHTWTLKLCNKTWSQ